MSEQMLNNPGVGMSPAFQRVPSNPNAVQNQPGQGDAPTGTSQVQPTPPNPAVPPTGGVSDIAQGTPPVDTPPYIPPARGTNGFQNQMTPPQPNPLTQPQPQPAPAQQQTIQQPYYDPRLQEQQLMIQQMQQEREALRREIAARDEAIRHLSGDAQELQNLRRQQAANDAVSKMDFSQFQTVDEEEARRISQATIEAQQSQFDAMRQELAKQRKFIEDSMASQREQMVQQAQLNNIQKVLAVHPDYYELQNTPAYQNFMRQYDGMSSQTFDQRAAYEFQHGNVEYVIDLLNKIKGQTPNPQQVMSVPPVQTAAGSVVPTTPQEKLPTLRELNDLMQTRQITHDEYRAMLNKLRAAQNQPTR